MATRAECVSRAGDLVAEQVLINATKTPREIAEESYNPSKPNLTVDVIEDRIRAKRGLPPMHSQRAS